MKVNLKFGTITMVITNEIIDRMCNYKFYIHYLEELINHRDDYDINFKYSPNEILKRNAAEFILRHGFILIRENMTIEENLDEIVAWHDNYLEIYKKVGE